MGKINHNRETNIIMLFGKNVNKLRRSKKMTQEELAALANTSQVQITRIESGKINTSISNALAIAKALDVDISILFEE